MRDSRQFLKVLILSAMRDYLFLLIIQCCNISDISYLRIMLKLCEKMQNQKATPQIPHLRQNLEGNHADFIRIVSLMYIRFHIYDSLFVGIRQNEKTPK